MNKPEKEFFDELMQQVSLIEKSRVLNGENKMNHDTEDERLSASEAVYGFCGWLTAQDVPIVMSARHECGRIVDLVSKFCKTNNLSEPRDRWADQLTHPPSLSTDTPVVARNTPTSDGMQRTGEPRVVKGGILTTYKTPKGGTVTYISSDTCQSPDSETASVTCLRNHTLYVAESEDDMSSLRDTAEVVITKSGKVIKDRWGILLHPYLSRMALSSDGGGCMRPGLPRLGDCENYLGLPGVSLPGQHDGPDDTVEVYGKPNGWCWSCWRLYQIGELRKEVQALEAWQEVAAESNRDIGTYLQEQLPSLEFDEGMPVGNVRKAIRHLQGKVDNIKDTIVLFPNPSHRIGLAIEKLSGDLSHDNVAAAKQILKKIIDE